MASVAVERGLGWMDHAHQTGVSGSSANGSWCLLCACRTCQTTFWAGENCKIVFCRWAGGFGRLGGCSILSLKYTSCEGQADGGGSYGLDFRYGMAWSPSPGLPVSDREISELWGLDSIIIGFRSFCGCPILRRMLGERSVAIGGVHVQA